MTGEEYVRKNRRRGLLMAKRCKDPAGLTAAEELELALLRREVAEYVEALYPYPPRWYVGKPLR